MVLCSANAPMFSDEILREENYTKERNADKIIIKSHPIDNLSKSETLKTIYVYEKE